MCMYFEITRDAEALITGQVLSLPALGFLLQRGCRVDLKG